MLRSALLLLVLAVAFPSVHGYQLEPKEDTIAKVKSVAVNQGELIVLEKENGEFKTVRTVKIGKSTAIKDHIADDKKETEIKLDQLRAGDIIVIGSTGSRVDYIIRYPKDPTEK